MSNESAPGAIGAPEAKWQVRWPLTREVRNASTVPAKYAQLHAQLLEAHTDPALQAYISGRWLDAVAGARASMKGNQREFRTTNRVALGAAAVSPALVAAIAATHGWVHTVLTIAAILTSLTAAIAAVLLQTARPGVKWRLNRTLRDQLEAIAWAHLAAVATEPSESSASQEAWAEFAAGVERAIGNHNGLYAEEVAGVLGSRSTPVPQAIEGP